MKYYEHKDRYDKSAVHRYPHGKTYEVINNCRMKDKTTGEWYDAVLYKEKGGTDIFCRELQSFDNEFREVE